MAFTLWKHCTWTKSSPPPYKLSSPLIKKSLIVPFAIPFYFLFAYLIETSNAEGNRTDNIKMRNRVTSFTSKWNWQRWKKKSDIYHTFPELHEMYFCSSSVRKISWHGCHSAPLIHKSTICVTDSCCQRMWKVLHSLFNSIFRSSDNISPYGTTRLLVKKETNYLKMVWPHLTYKPGISMETLRKLRQPGSGLKFAPRTSRV